MAGLKKQLVVLNIVKQFVAQHLMSKDVHLKAK